MFDSGILYRRPPRACQPTLTQLITRRWCICNHTDITGGDCHRWPLHCCQPDLHHNTNYSTEITSGRTLAELVPLQARGRRVWGRCPADYTSPKSHPRRFERRPLSLWILNSFISVYHHSHETSLSLTIAPIATNGVLKTKCDLQWVRSVGTHQPSYYFGSLYAKRGVFVLISNVL